MSQTRISLCMIVRNEEPHIRECLAAATEFCDEMIVVDTGSTDRTADIAREMGARVSQFAWVNDFAAARNASLAHATGEWVLYLDADERVDFFNGARLRRFLEQAPEVVPAFCLRIESEARHQHSGVWLSHYYPRVFRRVAGVRFEGALHEQLVGPRGPLCAVAPRLPVVIRHLGYTEAQREPGRRARNLAIVEAEAAQRPDDPLVRRNLANALLAAGEYAKATGLYRLLVDSVLPDEFLLQARWNLCICLMEVGDFRGALEALAPDDRTHCGLLLRAEAHRRAGDVDAAVDILNGLLEAPSAQVDGIMDFRAEPAHVHLQLAVCEGSRGYPARARVHLEEALRSNPNSPEARMQLAVMDENAGELERALSHLDKLVAGSPLLEEAHLGRFRVLMVLGRAREARAALLRGLQALPGQPQMRRLLETLDEDEAAAPGGPSSESGLSVCMIVRDAEAALGRALASVRGVAAEVVIVDTGSRDGTVALARSLGARVVESPWQDDFAAPRNLAVSLARGPWILSLDHDEELDPASVDELRGILSVGRWDAAEVAIANRLRGGDAVTGISHRYCRLFRKLPGVAFEGRVHEQVLPSLVRAGARVTRSDIRILHSGYSLEPGEMRAKQERNLALLKRELEGRPHDRFLQFHLGVTLFALGRGEEAAAPLKASLEGRSLPPEALCMAHVKLAQLGLAAGDRALARDHLVEAEAARPRSSLVTYLRAGVEFAEHNYAEASGLLGRLLAPGGGLACEESLDEGSLRLDRGNCLYYLGRFEDAITEYRRAAALQPDSALPRYNLGNAYYQLERFGEALLEFDAALKIDPALERALQNAWQCTARLAEGLEREGRDTELAALDVAGAPDPLRRMVAAARLRTGRRAEAVELLEEVRRGSPGDDEAAFLLAVALRESRRLPESLELFERLTAAHGTDAQVLFQHALALLDAGREPEAAELYGRAVEIDPSLAAEAAA